MKKTILALGLMAGLLMAGKSQAILIDRGNGLIYDNVLNITWLQDANYAKTSGFSADGTFHNWAAANSWAENLVYQGFSDWRLPIMDRIRGGTTVVSCITNVDCPGNEYGHMFYQNLNGAFGDNKNLNQVGDGGVTLNNILNEYWSGTEFLFDPSITLDPYAFTFDFGQGQIATANKDGVEGIRAWPVRPGDSAAAVPEVGSGLLMGLGLMVLRLTRRWRKA